MISRMEQINNKRMVQHPLYPWLKVDMRTQAEVEETRQRSPIFPIHRLARSARRKGRPLSVKKDLDGAYRIVGRLDDDPNAVFF